MKMREQFILSNQLSSRNVVDLHGIKAKIFKWKSMEALAWIKYVNPKMGHLLIIARIGSTLYRKLRI
jgi:hypothetical protein